MKDKKSCGNCAYFDDICLIQGKCKNLDHWFRNPRLWLSILPTEPGIYWWRDNNKEYLCTRMIFMSDKLREHCLVNPALSLEERGGQWQGPLTPNEGEGK
jgi:hypothetical protein